MTIAFSTITLLLLVTVVAYLISLYNSLMMMRNNISKAWSNINVLLTQRHAELTTLMEAVRGYMEFEQDVMVRVTEARVAFQQAKTVKEKSAADGIMTSTLRTLFAVSENYPQLKSSEAFLHFQTRISDIESQIADRREFFNHSVTLYNTRIQQFPDLFWARMLKYSKHPLFRSSALERTKPNVAL